MFGEKIKFFRQRENLSPDILVEKLAISRDEMDLWEKNESSPSIEYLLKMCDIFHTTLDEFCERSEVEPILAYGELRYDKETYLREFKAIIERPLVRLIISVIVWFLIGFTVLAHGSVKGSVIPFLIAAGLFYIMARFLLHEQKQLKINMRSKNRKVICRFFNNHFECIIKTDASFTRIDKKYEELNTVIHKDNYFIIRFHFYTVSIDLSKVSGERDALFAILNDRTKKQAPKKVIIVSQRKKILLRTLTLFLFLLTLLTFPLAVVAVSLSRNPYYVLGDAVRNWWIMFLFLPIPLSSVFLGIFSKRRSLKALKNIIAGTIVTIVLGSAGIFSLMDLFSTSIDYSLVSKIQDEIHVPLPANGYIYTQFDNVTDDNITWYEDSQVKFTGQSEMASFDNSLTANNFWLTSLPATDYQLLPFSHDFFTGYQYFLIYNVSLKEYNEVPAKGTYRFIMLAYDKIDCSMVIYQYSDTIAQKR